MGSLGKVVIPVEHDCSVAHISGENEDVRVGIEGRFLDL